MRHRVRHFARVLDITDHYAGHFKGRVLAQLVDTGQDGIAHWHDTLLDGQAVQLLHLVTGISTQRLAQEIPVGSLDNGVRAFARLDGGVLLHKLLHAGWAHPPDHMHAEGDLQVIPRQYGIPLRKILGVSVRRDRDIHHVQQPAAPRARRAGLQTYKLRLPQEGAAGEVSHITRRRRRITGETEEGDKCHEYPHD